MKLVLPLLMIFGCQKTSPQPEIKPEGFEKTAIPTLLTSGTIKEASGITDSRTVAGHLWVQQDSGNPPMIYLLSHNGAVADSVYLEGAVNRDWEDIATGKGPEDGIDYLFVGDIGDNDTKYPDYTIYRFAEPSTGVDILSNYEKIRFTYPDSAHDAEALVIDDVTKDIFIITKRDAKSRIYKLAYPQSTTGINEAVFITELAYSGVVSASLSVDGRELMLKTYTSVFYYKRQVGENLVQTFSKVPLSLDYQVEPQGEAICFALDGSGFFTLSEEALGVAPRINFYKRK